MSQEPAQRGRWKRGSQTPKLGIAAVGIVVLLLVSILALAGCSMGATGSPLVAVGDALSGSSTTAGSAATTVTSRALTTTGAKATTKAMSTTSAENTTTSAEETTTTGAEATTTTAGAGLELSIVEVTSPVSQGSLATVRAKTAPGADCEIVVKYKTGQSKAEGLEPTKADGAGNVSWTWKVSPNTTPGDWPILVTASMDGQSVAEETTFVVE